MKKTLVALAVAAVAATSANAAVVYEQNGSKVEVNGSLRVFLQKVSDARADLINDNSRLIVRGNHELGNGLSALGGLQLRFNGGNNTFDNPTTRNAFVGLSQEGVGTLTFGRQSTLADDNHQAGDYTYQWGGNLGVNGFRSTAGRSVKFQSADFGGFRLGAEYEFGNTSKNLPARSRYAVSALYSTALDQDVTLNLGAIYDIFESQNGNNDSRKSYRVSAEIVSGPLSFAYNYGQSKLGSAETTVHLVGAHYQATEQSGLYAQWNNTRDVSNTYVAGVDYKLHRNVLTYLEFAHVEPNSNSIGAGLRVSF